MWLALGIRGTELKQLRAWNWGNGKRGRKSLLTVQPSHSRPLTMSKNGYCTHEEAQTAVWEEVKKKLDEVIR